MSVKSTYEIKRETALGVILNNVSQCSDDEIEQMLECFEAPSVFRNYCIVNELAEDDYIPKIESEEDFFKTYI